MKTAMLVGARALAFRYVWVTSRVARMGRAITIILFGVTLSSSVRAESQQHRFRTYNLTISVDRTYSLGRSASIAHNASVDLPPSSEGHHTTKINFAIQSTRDLLGDLLKGRTINVVPQYDALFGERERTLRRELGFEQVDTLLALRRENMPKHIRGALTSGMNALESVWNKSVIPEDPIRLWSMIEKHQYNFEKSLLADFEGTFLQRAATVMKRALGSRANKREYWVQLLTDPGFIHEDKRDDAAARELSQLFSQKGDNLLASVRQTLGIEKDFDGLLRASFIAGRLIEMATRYVEGTKLTTAEQSEVIWRAAVAAMCFRRAGQIDRMTNIMLDTQPVLSQFLESAKAEGLTQAAEDAKQVNALWAQIVTDLLVHVFGADEHELAFVRLGRYDTPEEVAGHFMWAGAQLSAVGKLSEAAESYRRAFLVSAAATGR